MLFQGALFYYKQSTYFWVLFTFVTGNVACKHFITNAFIKRTICDILYMCMKIIHIKIHLLTLSFCTKAMPQLQGVAYHISSYMVSLLSHTLVFCFSLPPTSCYSSLQRLPWYSYWEYRANFFQRNYIVHSINCFQFYIVP